MSQALADSDGSGWLDAVALTGYMDGPLEAGWRGDAAQVRFAYSAASALRHGLWGAWLAGELAREEEGAVTEGDDGGR
jgi:hypothetical protein